MTTRPSGYPLQLDGALAPRLSRGPWLVKWLLVIPHFIVLLFLWTAFAMVTVIAFCAIRFTGRCPRSPFDFNVGVVRWGWRVGAYSYDALGTDQYPPFTLKDVSDYPAHVTVEYPQSLSRGLVLVERWLLALPHYLVIGVFTGGGWAIWTGSNPRTAAIAAPGAAARTALMRASGRPSSARPAPHPILNWLTVAPLHAINRAKVHQLQALSATTGDLT